MKVLKRPNLKSRKAGFAWQAFLPAALNVVGGIIGGKGEEKAAGMNQANMQAAVQAWMQQMGVIDKDYAKAERKLRKGTGALKAGFSQAAGAIRQGAGQASLAAQKAAYRAQTENMAQARNFMANRGLSSSTAAQRGYQGIRGQTSYGLGQTLAQIGAGKGAALGSLFAQRGTALAANKSLMAQMAAKHAAARGAATQGLSGVYTGTQVNAPKYDFGAIGGGLGSIFGLFGNDGTTPFSGAPGGNDPWGNPYQGPPSQTG